MPKPFTIDELLAFEFVMNSAQRSFTLFGSNGAQYSLDHSSAFDHSQLPLMELPPVQSYAKKSSFPCQAKAAALT